MKDLPAILRALADFCEAEGVHIPEDLLHPKKKPTRKKLQIDPGKQFIKAIAKNEFYGSGNN